MAFSFADPFEPVSFLAADLQPGAPLLRQLLLLAVVERGVQAPQRFPRGLLVALLHAGRRLHYHLRFLKKTGVWCNRLDYIVKVLQKRQLKLLVLSKTSVKKKTGDTTVILSAFP